MSARHMPASMVDAVAKSDPLFIENSAGAKLSRERGVITDTQYQSLIEWLRARAWERYERTIKTETNKHTNRQQNHNH